MWPFGSRPYNPDDDETDMDREKARILEEWGETHFDGTDRWGDGREIDITAEDDMSLSGGADHALTEGREIDITSRGEDDDNGPDGF